MRFTINILSVKSISGALAKIEAGNLLASPPMLQAITPGIAQKSPKMLLFPSQKVLHEFLITFQGINASSL